jgi:uncharacterized protein YbjT (DUF2867 family)
MLLGSGTQRLAPRYRDDLVEAIVHTTLDPDAPTGTFELAGPDVLTADEFVRHLNSTRVRIHRIPVVLARLLGHVVPTLTPELVDLLLADAVPTEDMAATAQWFRFELHRLADVWRSA